MTSMATKFAIVLALFLIGTFAHARETDTPAAPEEVIIMSAWSDPEKCNRGSALHLTVRQAISVGASLNGQCVAVKGYWSDRALFENRRDAKQKGSQVARSLRKRRIGLYANDEILASSPDTPESYVMIGVLGECESQWPRALMVMGYCHYTSGPILLLSQVFKS